MRKKFHRGQGSKNTIGKRTRVDPPVRVKRPDVAMLRENVKFSVIQRKVRDLTNEHTLLVNNRQLENRAKCSDKVEGGSF